MKNILFFLVWFSLIGLGAESSLDFTNAYEIESFRVKDFNRNTFSLTIKARTAQLRNELYATAAGERKDGKKVSKTFYYFKVFIGQIGTDVVPGTHQASGDRLTVDIYGFSTVPSGENQVDLYFKPPPVESGNEPADLWMNSLTYNVPERSTVTPIISRLYPSGGKEGDLITLIGKNLGEYPQMITIYLVDSRFGREYEAYNEKELGWVTPMSLSPPDENGFQEAKFTIPRGIIQNMDEPDILRNKLRLRVLINYSLATQETDKAVRLDILHGSWKKSIFLSSFFAVFLFLGLIPVFTGRWDFIQEMLKDKLTNTYSLSRFQAFIWTITLFGSYLYIALCYGLLKDGEIPEFNMSLLGLMGISYGSLISANHLNQKNPKNELRDRSPGLGDLIMYNGSIDITRFQMFSFSILTVGLYVFNLYNGDILMGMPDIPTTLHGLLLSSQAGYLGGKMAGDKMVVNQILPSSVRITDTKEEFTLIGNGFTDGMKIMIGGQEPIKVKFIDPTTVKFAPKAYNSVGMKSLLLIPTSGASMEIRDAIEILPKDALDE